MSVQSWIRAARLRTLPLAMASTLCGSMLAALHQQQHRLTSLLLLATAVSLQVFSNFANDYGDAQNGADAAKRKAAKRKAPKPTVPSEQISTAAMQKGLKISAAVCCVLGLLLLISTLPTVAHNDWQSWLWWLLLGAASLAAAYRYTAGRKPYGYAGLGDVAVFLFFGWVAVLGSEYLHTGRLNPSSWLPASSMGWWCVMVLNLNNMRDMDSDKVAGKRTLAVRFGWRAARIYHIVLAVTAALTWCAWLVLHASGWRGAVLHLFMLAATFVHLKLLKNTSSPAELDRLLPQWSVTVLVWVTVLALLLGK